MKRSLFLAALLAASCGSSSDMVCEPGRVQSCSCAGDVEGTHACLGDGSGWGACDCPCVPDCTARECGPDGCGGRCGQCIGCDGVHDPALCVDAACMQVCCPDCTDRECGDDGCGGQCGECTGCEGVHDPALCHAGMCDQVCCPDCTDRECGDDGCGGICGTCTAPASCDIATGMCAGDPCLAVSPVTIDFGARLVQVPATISVNLHSCGTTAVHIRGLRLMEDAEVPGVTLSPDFALDLGQLPGIDPGTTAIVEGDPPLILDTNVTAAFDVQFTPDEVNPTDENGEPVPDIAFIQILANTLVSETRLEVRGHGIAVECPTAVIKVLEGEEVVPGTVLHLVGSQSYAVSGSISRYEWSVTQPPGSQSVFMPSASEPDPTFEVNVAGIYLFQLMVWDDNDVPADAPAEATVTVTPE